MSAKTKDDRDVLETAPPKAHWAAELGQQKRAKHDRHEEEAARRIEGAAIRTQDWRECREQWWTEVGAELARVLQSYERAGGSRVPLRATETQYVVRASARWMVAILRGPWFEDNEAVTVQEVMPSRSLERQIAVMDLDASALAPDAFVKNAVGQWLQALPITAGEED